MLVDPTARIARQFQSIGAFPPANTGYTLLPFRFARLPKRPGEVLLTSETGEYIFVPDRLVKPLRVRVAGWNRPVAIVNICRAVQRGRDCERVLFEEGQDLCSGVVKSRGDGEGDALIRRSGAASDLFHDLSNCRKGEERFAALKLDRDFL